MAQNTASEQFWWRCVHRCDCGEPKKPKEKLTYKESKKLIIAKFKLAIGLHHPR